MVTWTKSYLCESVLVQKTWTEPRTTGSWGCSQRAPAMSVSERPVHVSSQGGVSAEATCELPPRRRSIGSNPQVRFAEDREYGHLLRLLWCVALSCGYKGESFNRMKSHAVSVCLWDRASEVYKVKPKRPVTRRIREAVSGSTDLWDGSRAVVASCNRGGETQNRFK